VTIIVIIFLRDSDHLLFLLIVAVGLGILLVFLTLPYLLRTFEFSLLRSTPLREAIAAGIASAPFQVPTYCTLARRVDIADPGETRGAPTVEQFIRSGGYPLSEDRIAELIASLPMLPAPRRVTVPEYFRIDKAADDLRIRILLGSAALPYGLFPEARPDGTWSYFDGGVADNTPLYPLISDCLCNELVIVYLRPLKGTQESRIAAHMDRCRALDRLLRLADIPATLKREILYRMWKGQPNVSVPVVDYPFWPERIIEVAPKQSLGNFFTGTLNIRWKKAKELIRAGYEDAQEVIHTNWPGLHSGAPLWP
jgi:hypothetical protein